MQLVLISGLSGSGKSIALNALEDSGYYCVDNLPGQLLQESAELLRRAGHKRVAMSIDARTGDSLDQVPGYVAALKSQGVDLRLLFLDTKNDTLIRRFSETRRRHPLATGTRTLEECLTRERELLAPIGEIGQRLDTSEPAAEHAAQLDQGPARHPHRIGDAPVRVVQLQAGRSPGRGSDVRRALPAQSVLRSQASSA